MRLYLILLLIAAGVPFCSAPKEFSHPQAPFVLHVWIYAGTEAADLQTIVDSSRCHYTVAYVKEGDGCTRVAFSFQPDPSQARIKKLFKRLQCFKGMRGFTTTRGDIKNNENTDRTQ